MVQFNCQESDSLGVMVLRFSVMDGGEEPENAME